MIHADRCYSFICVCNYNILEQRDYLTIFTYLKYNAYISVHYLIGYFTNVFFSFLLLSSFTFCNRQKA